MTWSPSTWPGDRSAQIEWHGSKVGDHVDLDQRVSRNATGGRDGCPHGRLLAKPAQKYLVHSCIVLQIIQINIALQDLVHRGTGGFELLLNLIEHTFGVNLDVAFSVIPYACDEQQ